MLDVAVSCPVGMPVHLFAFEQGQHNEMDGIELVDIES